MAGKARRKRRNRRRFACHACLQSTIPKGIFHMAKCKYLFAAVRADTRAYSSAVDVRPFKGAFTYHLVYCRRSALLETKSLDSAAWQAQYLFKLQSHCRSRLRSPRVLSPFPALLADYESTLLSGSTTGKGVSEGLKRKRFCGRECLLKQRVLFFFARHYGYSQAACSNYDCTALHR